MPQDPLSIAATILPGSSFDPVAFASEERKRLLGEQKEKRTRYNELFDKISSVSGGNPWDEGLRSQRQQIIDEGANALAEGVDVTDITNPQSGRKAAEFRGKIEKLNNDAKMSQAIQGLVANTRQLLAKDAQDRGGESSYDAEATMANIQNLMSKKSITEAQQYLSGLGDNLLVAKPIKVDIDKTISDNLPKYAKGIKKGDESLQDGKVVEKAWQEYTPQEVRTAFKGMLTEIPNLEQSVEKEKSEYPLLLRNMNNVDFMMMTRGNKAARQSISEMSSLYTPKSTKGEEPEKPKYQSMTEPIKTTFSFKTGKDGKIGKTYESTGENPILFDQSKSFNVSPGSGTLDIENSQPANIKGSVNFKPVNTSEYTVSTKDYKGWKAGTILPDSEKGKPNTKKVRFVEGVYTAKVVKKAGDKEIIEAVPKTILVPYDNIKNELDVTYKVGRDIPKSVNEVTRYYNGKPAIFDADTKKFIRWE